MFVVLDVETSGLPLFKEPSEHPDQPFVVSIAVLTLNQETLAETSRIYAILQPPPGRTIPDDVVKVHGITTERALAEGTDRETAIRLYMVMRRQCAGSVAHNAPFDVRMMRIEMLRLGLTKEEIEAIEASSPQFCTQKLATPILKLPATARMRAAGFNKPKSASLAECMKMLLDEVDEGAHGALADARACAKVFRWLRDNGHVTLPALAKETT